MLLNFYYQYYLHLKSIQKLIKILLNSIHINKIIIKLFENIKIFITLPSLIERYNSYHPLHVRIFGFEESAFYVINKKICLNYFLILNLHLQGCLLLF